MNDSKVNESFCRFSSYIIFKFNIIKNIKNHILLLFRSFMIILYIIIFKINIIKDIRDYYFCDQSSLIVCCYMY